MGILNVLTRVQMKRWRTGVLNETYGVTSRALAEVSGYACLVRERLSKL